MRRTLIDSSLMKRDGVQFTVMDSVSTFLCEPTFAVSQLSFCFLKPGFPFPVETDPSMTQLTSYPTVLFLALSLGY